jgi:hypothetical protein
LLAVLLLWLPNFFAADQEVQSVLGKLFECHNCGSFNGYSSRPRGFAEKYLLPLFLLRPVRCGDCSRRTFQSRLVAVQQRRQSKSEPAATAYGPNGLNG